MAYTWTIQELPPLGPADLFNASAARTVDTGEFASATQPAARVVRNNLAFRADPRSGAKPGHLYRVVYSKKPRGKSAGYFDIPARVAPQPAIGE